MVGKYFRIKKELDNFPIGTVVYCNKLAKPECEENYKEFWFQNVDILPQYSLIVIPSEQVSNYLEEISVDKYSIFQKVASELLADIERELKCNKKLKLPVSAKYVLDDIKRGEISKAFDGLETECDKIRHSVLGKILRSYCVDI